MAKNKPPRILRSQRSIVGQFEVVNPRAAGVDAGSEKHLVSVPEDCSDEPVREFQTFTTDLNRLADWLLVCGITTVAIEATGVYWIPLFEILEARGLNPRLVDARSVGKRKKKTDVLDCQWIRQLHMFGLLDEAFRPPQQILELRSYMRQRRRLIELAAQHVQHIQKALDLMNVKLHLILSDVMGVTGLRIIRAILAGHRDPAELATLRDQSCKNSEEVFVQALIGNYRDEHLFELRHAVELFETYQDKIAECDSRIKDLLTQLAPSTEPMPEPRRAKSRRKNEPHFDVSFLLNAIAGVDLTRIHGFSPSTVMTLIAETGTDMSPWPGGKQFAAWLNLSPNNLITGGKPIRRKGPPIRSNRAAQAFRLAAQTLERSQSALGAFFRRIRTRHGRQVAIKATAHKLALIYYAMLKNKTDYRDPGADYYEQRYRENLLKSMNKKALTLGFQLTPLQSCH